MGQYLQVLTFNSIERQSLRVLLSEEQPFSLHTEHSKPNLKALLILLEKFRAVPWFRWCSYSTIQPLIFFFCTFVLQITCTSFINHSSFVSYPPLVESSKPSQRKFDRKGRMRGSLLFRSVFIVNISTLRTLHRRARGKNITLWLFPGWPKTLNDVLRSVFLQFRCQLFGLCSCLLGNKINWISILLSN